MEWYEAEVRELVARLAAEPVSQPAVFYGSSSIRLWTTLAQDLKDESAVNAGFGGSTLEACAHFFDRIIPPLEPASLVVYAGDNDLGDGRAPEHVAESFRRLTAKLERCCGEIPFGFMSIKPSPARAYLRENIRRTNELIRADIIARPNWFYIPISEGMVQNRGPAPELFADDGLHLGPAGYALWTQLLEPYRDRIFQKRQSDPQTPQSADGGAPATSTTQ